MAIKFKMTLKKSDVKAFMYKGQVFKNKNEFWSSVEVKRAMRAEERKGLMDTRKPYKRYEKLIPEENFAKLEKIIFRAVGEPSFWEVGQ